MNKRFHLIIATLLVGMFFGGQIVYGQNASSRSFPNIVKVDSQNSAFQPKIKGNSLISEDLSEKLRAVLLGVKNGTSIPVLVPAVMPHAGNEQNVCVNGGSGSDSYMITISEEPECGANAGMIANFTAERNAVLPEESEADKVVSLANGIEGFYTAKSCGASCSPSQIEFVYENVLYSFQINSAETEGESGDEAQIVEMVNSALLSAEN